MKKVFEQLRIAPRLSIATGRQESQQPFAEIVDYDSLVLALRQRAEDLRISRENIDDICGWADRLAGKLLSLAPVGQRQDGSRRAARRLGMQTLGPLLSAPGLKLIAVEDPETLERYRDRRTPREESKVRTRKSDI